MGRYIDADELKELYEGCEDLRVKCAVVLLNIDDMPTADVVEVVRCKDCQYSVANQERDILDGTDYSGNDIVCSYFMTDGLENDDYCSYGKKVE